MRVCFWLNSDGVLGLGWPFIIIIINNLLLLLLVKVIFLLKKLVG